MPTKNKEDNEEELSVETFLIFDWVRVILNLCGFCAHSTIYIHTYTIILAYCLIRLVGDERKKLLSANRLC